MESGSLVKAFAILEVLSAAEGGQMSLAELALRASISKPSAHRILQSLIELGYVVRGAPGAYRLTDRLRRLSLPPDDRTLLAASEKVLDSIHRQTGETVNLGVLRRDHVEYLLVLETPHALRRVPSPGADPFYCTALGRAIVAFQSPTRRDALLRRDRLRPMTPKTVTEPAKLRAILQTVRRLGVAIERDQTDLGVTCVGAPVLVDGTPVAAVSISAPTARVDAALERQWTTLLRTSTLRISQALIRARRRSA